MDVPQLSRARLGVLHLQEILGIGRRHLGVYVHLVGEQHVGAGEWRAIVPGDIPAQVKGDGQLILGDLPRFGQLPFEFQVFIVTDQAVVNQSVDITRRRIGRQHRQQVARFTDRGFDEGVAVHRFCRLALGRDHGLFLITGGEEEQQGNHDPCHGALLC